MSPPSANASSPQPPIAKKPRALSLGVIFLTLYIDLVGFSIIFPLFPDILKHYLAVDGQSGALGWLVAQSDALAHFFGKDQHFAAVLFGGFLSSIYAVLQFLCAPLWGAWSDRLGRRQILLWTVVGNTFSYALWVFSGSFWMFIVARLLGGIFSGNISVATAAVADVTSREERSKAMGIVGAAFGLGLVTGPAIGAFCAKFNLLDGHPELARFGLNPFSVAALVSFGMSLLSLVWIATRFKETLSAENKAAALERGAERVRHPLRTIFGLTHPGIRNANTLAFLYSLAFCGMEFSLAFLAADRFGYTAVQNGKLMAFLGVFSVLTQGFIVRRLLKRGNEVRVLRSGLLISLVALLVIGFAATPWVLYLGLALVAIGSGLINPASTGLLSLYSNAQEQGRMLGLFRSLGSLARAVTPVCAGILFWTLGASSVFVLGAAFTALGLVFCSRLPSPDLSAEK